MVSKTSDQKEILIIEIRKMFVLIDT